MEQMAMMALTRAWALGLGTRVKPGEAQQEPARWEPDRSDGVAMRPARGLGLRLVKILVPGRHS